MSPDSTTVKCDQISKRLEKLKRQVGDRYSECSLETFIISSESDVALRQRAALALMEQFCERMSHSISSGSGMFLFGPVGCGKDHLMSAAMFRAIECGFSVQWWNGLDLYGRFRDAMDAKIPEATQIQSLVYPDVLALSDPLPPLGDITPYQRTMLFRAVDARYREKKPTWITANVANRTEADTRVGPQLVDRLTDGALTIACSWPSYRLTNRWGAK